MTALLNFKEGFVFFSFAGDKPDSSMRIFTQRFPKQAQCSKLPDDKRQRSSQFKFGATGKTAVGVPPKELLDSVVRILVDIQSEIQPRVRELWMQAWQREGLSEENAKALLTAVKMPRLRGRAVGFVINTSQGKRIITNWHVSNPFCLFSDKATVQNEGTKASLDEIELPLPPSQFLQRAKGYQITAYPLNSTSKIPLDVDQVPLNPSTLAEDPLADIAVLKPLEANALDAIPPLKLAAKTSRVGKGVFALTTESSEGEVKCGKALEIFINKIRKHKVLKGQPATGPGDSGAAVVNRQGEVTGVVVAGTPRACH